MTYSTKYYMNPLPLSFFITEGAHSSVGRAGIETSSENVHLDRSKGDKIPRKSTENRVSKRKQVDVDSDSVHRDNGREPSRHRSVKLPKVPDDSHTKAGGKLAGGAKGRRCAARSKLLPGQTQLTQFFRL